MNLEWTEEQYNKYEGEDLLIITGVPGSKWSGVVGRISHYIDINFTDRTPEREYGIIKIDPITGEEKNYGWHKAAYWGPYHEFGKQFYDMSVLTKREVIEEFTAPFEDWDGIKIIKSHWFVYNMDQLAEIFPKAKILGIYLPDDVAFKWWHVLGGWDIYYPHYDWYGNDDRLKAEIKIGNGLLLKFFTERGIPFSTRLEYDKFCSEELGLGLEKRKSKKHLNAKNQIQSSSSLLAVFDGAIHNNTNVLLDELMSIRPKTLEKLNLVTKDPDDTLESKF